MKNPLRYLKNALGSAIRTARYRGALRMGAVQTFDHLHTELRRGGRIRMGSYNQNRGHLYLVADGGRIEIGSHCFFNTGACVTSVESVRIGDGCKFGNNVVIVDHDHNFRGKSEERSAAGGGMPAARSGSSSGEMSEERQENAAGSGSRVAAPPPEFLSAPVTIGQNVWVGANVVILRGTTLGDGCVVGAGCVVKGEVAPGTVLAGRTAQPIGEASAGRR